MLQLLWTQEIKEFLKQSVLPKNVRKELGSLWEFFEKAGGFENVASLGRGFRIGNWNQKTWRVGIVYKFLDTVQTLKKEL